MVLQLLPGLGRTVATSPLNQKAALVVASRFWCNGVLQVAGAAEGGEPAEKASKLELLVWSSVCLLVLLGVLPVEAVSKHVAVGLSV